MNNKSAERKISVIVPIYGVEKYLSQCVESLIDQTYKDLEIILVNDGSPDNSATLCDRYASLDKRIRVIHKENEGLVSARKEGLKLASAEYIGFVDGDDWVEPEMFDNMIESALSHGADIVAAGHKEELAGKVVEVLQNNIAGGIYRGSELIDKIYPKMLNNGRFSQFGIFTYHWNKLFRKSVLYRNQMDVDEGIFLGEDAACVYPSILDASALYISSSAFYHYRQRTDSMVKTRKGTVHDLDKFNRLYRFFRKRFGASRHAPLLLPQLDLFLLSLLTVRSDLMMYSGVDRTELFPFPEVKTGSRVVICGAGTFGQHLQKGLQASEGYQVMGWIDELYSEYRQQGLNVDSPSSILQVEYDHVIVAFIDESNAATVAKKLNEMGVPENKIARVSHYADGDIADLLKEFGIRS